ncbi:hypothetical protein BKA70DRAFT_581745 [Coprinopsis sp. MPI-PUGE-AT-0042]|nr:hypothetical protein BKA70DRAFT_581745 [Coprinopsis sp. MPI-PUGE-AT-0042]
MMNSRRTTCRTHPPPPPPVAKTKAQKQQRAAPTPKASTSTAPSSPRKTRPTTQRSTAKSRKVKAALQKPFLPHPSSGNQGLTIIYEWINSKMINLCPDYQRDIVWGEDKMINLIDSLRHNYPIPPILCALNYDDNGNARRTCIDGRQRLTSIHKFMIGEIPYKDSITGEKTYYIKSPNVKGGKLMSEERKSEFRAKSLTFQDYQGITVEQEMEIFSRVQMGVSLTLPERLQSVTSATAGLIREFRNELNETNVFIGLGEWGGNRGKDFLVLAQVAYLLRHSTDKTIHNPTTDRVSTWIHKEESLSVIQDLHHGLKQAFDIFCRIVHHPVYRGALLDTPLSTLEFVLSIYLIHVYKKRMTDCQTSDAIDQLRQFIRRKDPQCKFSPANFKAALAFLQGIKHARMDKVKTVAADEPPLDPAQLKVEEDEDAPVPPPPPPPPTKSKKRSRPDPPVQDDMDVDEPPAAASKKRKVSLPEPKPTMRPSDDDDDDSGSEEDAPLSHGLKGKKAPAKKASLSQQARAGPSAAATRVRKPAASKAKSAAPLSKSSKDASSSSMPTAKSLQHPSLRGVAPSFEDRTTPSHSAAPTPQIPAVAPPPYTMHLHDSEMRALDAPTYPTPSQPTHGSSNPFANQGLTGGQDRLAGVRGWDAVIASHGPVGGSTSSSQRAELPAAVHKLPTPPVQDEPRHQQDTTYRSTAVSGHRSAPPHHGSFAAQQQQQQQQQPTSQGLWPTQAMPGSSIPSSVPGKTLKDLNFKKNPAPPPTSAAPPSLPPARQRQAQANQASAPQALTPAQALAILRQQEQEQLAIGRLGPASFGAPATVGNRAVGPAQGQRRPSAPEVGSNLPPPPPRRSLPGPGRPGSPQRLGEALALGRRPGPQEPPPKDPRQRC